MKQYKDQNGKYSLNPKRLFSNKMINDTIKYQQKYGFEIGQNNSTWNNEADAFKHAYMQAILALRTNEQIAKFLGDSHEKSGVDKGQPQGEDNMDRWNNKQGRNIAKEIIKEYGFNAKLYPNATLENIIAEKIIKQMQNGDLITKPSDTREYKEHIHGQGTKIFTREEIDQMSLEEFSKNEEAIMKQLKDKGIPTNREFEKSSKSKTATKMKSSGKGHWVTINGNHVFIED